MSTGKWIVPQQDPYDLTIFRKAVDSVGLSNEDLSINATHYAIKFFPKNEEEQWDIELTDGVKVDYTPFNYTTVPYEADKQLGPKPHNKSLIIDDCKYVVNYSVMCKDDIEEEIVSETYRIPVLYTIWPIDKTLPQGIEYEIDHFVFLPDYKRNLNEGSTNKILKAVEREAINLALGSYPKEFEDATRDNDIITLKGYVYRQDPLIDSLIGQHNLKVRFKLGSNIYDTYVQQDGFFSVTGAINTSFSHNHVFQHPKWKITNASDSAPTIFNWGTVSLKWHSIDDIPVMIPNSSPSYYAVLPAVNFYYNGSHSIRTWHYNSGIRIIMTGVVSENNSPASFYYGSSPTYIKVNEDWAGVDNKLMGSVLHEFGHFTMFCECGGYNNFITVDDLICESYASYAGWYLTTRRYGLLGCPESPSIYGYTGQSRQTWQKTGDSTRVYSPLFVDLVDAYNQSSYNSIYNDDDITLGPFVHTLIRNMASQCRTWSHVRSSLSTYVGQYYTQSEFDSFADPYDYWYEHN